jgi:hypothetical protein
MWVLFRWDWLAVAGAYIIAVGVVLFLIGVFCLGRFRVLALSDVHMSYRRRFWLSFACAWLLFSNIPAAAAIILAVIHIESQYTVIVDNQSDGAIEEFTLSGGGVRFSFGTIEPDTRVRRSFRIQRDGVLMCSGIHRGKPLEAQVDGYVTNGMGGRKLIQITPDAVLVVTDIDYD